MKRLIISISDMKISTARNSVLITHSLGSCLGLTAYDPVGGIGGLIHCLLPKACEHGEVKNQYMFVNTGVPAMIRRMVAKGASLNRMVFKAAGCGRMLQIASSLDIGAQNFAMLESLFAANGVMLASMDVGGSIPRTMSLDLADGRVLITSQGKEWEL
jgi:chemotaxis protein CheD